MRAYNRIFNSVFPIAAMLVLFSTSSPILGQDAPTPAEFLPPSTVIYGEIKAPPDVIEALKSHPVVGQILEIEGIQTLMRTPQFAAVMMFWGLLEQELEEDLFESLKQQTQNGIWFAVDFKSEAVVLMFRAKDEAGLKRTVGKLLKISSQWLPDQPPFKKVNYRDAVAAEIQGAGLIARYQDWFIITNQSKMAKKIVDNLIDGAASSLSKSPWFTQVSQKNEQSDVWLAADLETIRTTINNPSAFEGKTDNPAIEILLGGILDTLQHAPTATARLTINSSLQLSISAPFEPDWANEHREYFYGTDNQGRAPVPLRPRNMIANLSTYRDIGRWWLSKEDLYDESVIAQLTQADTQLSTIFSGMDFGQDVLGALKPGVQIIVAENEYEKDYEPDLKLPAFALVGKLKDPQKLRRRLNIAFQSVIGFANINLGMNGQPQLEVETENINKTKITSAEYFYEDDTEEGLILFNFSPSIAYTGEHLILSSNRKLALELSQLVAGTPGAYESQSNTLATIDSEQLTKTLGANRESFITQNMLEEGNDRRDAEYAIDLALSIAELIKMIQFDLEVTPQRMNFQFELGFQPSENTSASQKQ